MSSRKCQGELARYHWPMCAPGAVLDDGGTSIPLMLALNAPLSNWLRAPCVLARYIRRLIDGNVNKKSASRSRSILDRHANLKRLLSNHASPVGAGNSGVELGAARVDPFRIGPGVLSLIPAY